MKIAALIARYLLGIEFLVFGLNNFLHFIPQPPVSGPTGQYFAALVLSHTVEVAGALEVIAAVLLLAGYYVPLALVLLGPILVNIWMFHLSMQIEGLPPGAISTVLWGLIFFRYRAAFAGIFAAKG